MQLPAWLKLFLFGLLVALGVCAYQLLRGRQTVESAHGQAAAVRQQLDQAQLVNREFAGQNQELEAQNRELTRQLAQRDELIRELRDQERSVATAKNQLEEEMRQAIASKDVRISELQGKLTVDILDRVLFASGQAELKPEGAEVLRQVAGVLRHYPNRQVVVFGHTDNIPIRGALAVRFPSNWELSAARATAAVRFLMEQAGVEPRRLAAAGCGEFRPLADNATEAGRARNRRIELVVLPEELLAARAEPVPGLPAVLSAPAPAAASPEAAAVPAVEPPL